MRKNFFLVFLAGNRIVIFDIRLETKGGEPLLNQNSVAKFL